MIARLWSARTTSAQSRAYLDHFSASVLPELRQFPGYAGSTVMTREAQGSVEILVTTLWESLAAIDAFAGPDRESAVVADEAAALLTDFDRRVRHYELVYAKFPISARSS
jgi:heme-degrading monooxygenase HmoA